MRAGWQLWVYWVLASLAGVLAGLVLAEFVWRPILGPAIDQAGDGDWGSYFLSLAVASTTIGAWIGLMQWFILRRRIAQAGWWILASASGFFTSAVVFEAFHVPLSDRMLGVLGGVAVGAIQWLVLRRQIPTAYWWVPATALGIAAADIAARLVGAGGIIAWSITLGSITGGAMIWLLRRAAGRAQAAA